MHADLQRLLDSELLSDLGAVTMDRLRQIRADLTRAEGDISLARRVAQGRMDIVGHEVDRRAGAGEPLGDSLDPSGLLFDMPDILTDGAGRAGRGTRPAMVGEPGPVALSLIGALDGIASPSQLSGLAALDRPSVGDLFEALREFELELSSIRRRLHDRIDAIQEEIARRYRDGEASVDALLQ